MYISPFCFLLVPIFSSFAHQFFWFGIFGRARWTFGRLGKVSVGAVVFSGLLLLLLLAVPFWWFQLFTFLFRSLFWCSGVSLFYLSMLDIRGVGVGCCCYTLLFPSWRTFLCSCTVVGPVPASLLFLMFVSFSVYLLLLPSLPQKLDELDTT